MHVSSFVDAVTSPTEKAPKPKLQVHTPKPKHTEGNHQKTHDDGHRLGGPRCGAEDANGLPPDEGEHEGPLSNNLILFESGSDLGAPHDIPIYN